MQFQTRAKVRENAFGFFWGVVVEGGGVGKDIGMEGVHLNQHRGPTFIQNLAQQSK